ncbi:Protein of unknown function, partial [Gryllus bimaculatus]
LAITLGRAEGRASVFHRCRKTCRVTETFVDSLPCLCLTDNNKQPFAEVKVAVRRKKCCLFSNTRTSRHRAEVKCMSVKERNFQQTKTPSSYFGHVGGYAASRNIFKILPLRVSPPSTWPSAATPAVVLRSCKQCGVVCKLLLTLREIEKDDAAGTRRTFRSNIPPGLDCLPRTPVLTQ